MNPYATLIVFAAAFVVSQGLAAINATTAKESAITARESEGKCFCQTNMNVNIPPCTCSGMVETVAENQQLKAEVKELRDNCTVVVNSLSPCKTLIMNATVHLLKSYILFVHRWLTCKCGRSSLDKILVVHSCRWLACWGNGCPWRFVNACSAYTNSQIFLQVT